MRNCDDHETRLRTQEIAQGRTDLRIERLEQTVERILIIVESLKGVITRAVAIASFLAFLAPILVPWLKDMLRTIANGA